MNKMKILLLLQLILRPVGIFSGSGANNHSGIIIIIIIIHYFFLFTKKDNFIFYLHKPNTILLNAGAIDFLV